PEFPGELAGSAAVFPDMKRHCTAAALAAALLLAAACDRSQPLALSTQPSRVAAPQLAAEAVALEVSGNARLTAIGQTAQLTATARMSDGTTRNVTGEAVWESDDPATLAVSDTGRVTALR